MSIKGAHTQEGAQTLGIQVLTQTHLRGGGGELLGEELCHGVLPFHPGQVGLADLEARVPGAKVDQDDVILGDRRKLGKNVVPELRLVRAE